MSGPTLDELQIADEPEAWRASGFTVEGDLCEVGAVGLRLEGRGPRRGIVSWSLRNAPSLELDGLAVREGAGSARTGAMPSVREGAGSARTGAMPSVREGAGSARTGAMPSARAGAGSARTGAMSSVRAGAGSARTGARHPNGVLSIDHVVVLSPDFHRTVAALRDAGFDLRRVREGATPGGSTRQAFFRVGEPILEVVAAPAGTSVAADPDGPARLWGISFLVTDLAATGAVLDGLLGEPRDAVQPGRRIATLRSEAGLGPAVAFMTPGPGAV